MYCRLLNSTSSENIFIITTQFALQSCIVDYSAINLILCNAASFIEHANVLSLPVTPWNLLFVFMRRYQSCGDHRHTLLSHFASFTLLFDALLWSVRLHTFFAEAFFLAFLREMFKKTHYHVHYVMVDFTGCANTIKLCFSIRNYIILFFP